MKTILSSLLPAAALSGLLVASCTVDDAPPAGAPPNEMDLSAVLAAFPSGFVKMNAQPFQTHAQYSQDSVNVWVDAYAVDLYRSLPGATQPVTPGWTGSDVPPANSFPQGSIMVRQDTTTGELAVMARVTDAAPNGEISWKWLKRDATSLYDGQNCWSCHGEFGATDGAIGVAANQR